MIPDTPSIASVDAMRERITDEVFYALGLRKSGTLRKLLGRLFYRPTQRFARIFAAADDAVGRAGMPAGCASVVHDFGVRVTSRGTENIPAEGPVIVASNHPGAYDSVCLGSCVLHRQDLRIIVYEVGFYHAMPNCDRQFIYATDDQSGRMLTLRTAIQHLNQGGSLLQFGTGLIDPDPEVFPGAEEEVEKWSPSVEVMLRKCPETKLVLTAASGVVLPRFAYHPVTRLRQTPMDRRRLAEVTQILTQLASPGSVKINAHFSFAEPVTVEELSRESDGRRLMPAIIAREKQLLRDHVAWVASLTPE
jgi:hypothetical protein